MKSIKSNIQVFNSTSKLKWNHIVPGWNHIVPTWNCIQGESKKSGISKSMYIALRAIRNTGVVRHTYI